MAELQAHPAGIGEPQERRVEWSRLAGAGALAAVAGVAGADALYLGAAAAGLLDGRVVLPSMIGMGPLRLASVSMTAGAAVAGACVVYGILRATVRRPVRTFRVLATSLALGSLFMPATIPGPSMAMRLVMAGMHAAVWAAAAGLLVTLADERTRTGS